MHIVIPGGSGHIGTLLARHFHAQGQAVTVLARRPVPAPWAVLPWDGVHAGPWTAALEGADAVINLAGRSVDCRYTPANRRDIYDSRILSTRLLGEIIARLRTPPRTWINAGTATIYRHALDRPMDEESGELGGGEPGAPSTWNFSIKVARDWEREVLEAPTPGTRRVILRSAMTFQPDRGSVFDVLSRLVRLGLGGTNGPGTQYVSWIHQDDFVGAVDLLLTDQSWTGAVNVASPHPLPNREFMRALRQAWGVHVGLPATEWMIEAAAFFMRTESELLLKSRRVVPGRLLAAGFEFRFPEWPAAARDLVARLRTSQRGSPVSA